MRTGTRTVFGVRPSAAELALSSSSVVDVVMGAPPAVAIAVSSGGGPNHALDVVLTFLSCGLWLPIWILVAIFSNRGLSAVVASGGGELAYVGRTCLMGHR